MDHVATPTQGTPQQPEISTLEDQAITANNSDLPTRVSTRWLQDQISLDWNNN